MQIHLNLLQTNLKTYFDLQLDIFSNLDFSQELYEKQIGSHFRHCIQMIEIFLEYYQKGNIINYTQRDRESKEALKILLSKEYGIERMNFLLNQLFILNLTQGEFDVKRDFGILKSNVEIELDFLASHTMHHFGLIRIYLERECSKQELGFFGFAPETIDYLKNKEN